MKKECRATEGLKVYLPWGNGERGERTDAGGGTKKRWHAGERKEY